MTTKSGSSSRAERLRGSQQPSVRSVTESDYTDGDDAIEILRLGGLKVDEWQGNVLRDWMGRDEVENIWTASTCGLTVPRQNGKTLVTVGRIAAGMILYGEWVIYTAHLQKTSTETFMELRSIFESKRLNKYVKEIKNAIGREQIILHNGGRVVFVARTRNGGRGLHGDILVFDEAQELTTEQQASFLPALAASQNPQTAYLGTPPDESCVGTVFRNIRTKVLNDEGDNIAWTEFSVDKIGDVTDRTRWAATNPALGIRIRETTIAAECEQMDPDTFARERLGWWSPIAENNIDYVLDKEKWDKCASNDKKPDGKTAYGVKFSADGSEVCLAGAVIPQDGIARISLIERKPTGRGTRWLAEWLNERANKASCVVIDGRNGVDVLIDRIADCWRFKDSVIKPSTANVIAAVSLLVDCVNEGSLTWYKPQEALRDSAVSSVKRGIGSGYGFGGSDSAPIEACSLALWGAKNSKRDPNKKMRIG